MLSSRPLSKEEIELEQASFITKVYSWMSLALLVTGLVAYWAATTPAVMEEIFATRFTFYLLIGAELLCVYVLSRNINRFSANTSTMLFLGYSALNGLTFSVIFLIYTTQSIASTFFITAVTFGVMSAYGYFTKKDLTSWGNLLFMALIGLIISSVVNIFLQSEMLYYAVSYIGVLIFVGLTAYDTQKIKQMNIIGNAGTEEDHKEAIMGALTLYLDFINMFLFLLRILGNRR